MQTRYLPKHKIIDWLNSHEINNYHIRNDNEFNYCVDVVGDVNLSYKKLQIIPIKFNIISGHFNCSNNITKDLSFAPKLVHGDFDCSSNALKTLKDAPQKIKGSFLCQRNAIESLKNAPQEVIGDFNCSHNKITSLQGITEIIGKNLICKNNQLTTIEFSSQKIGQSFYLDNNAIAQINIADLPQTVNGFISLLNNPIEQHINDTQFLSISMLKVFLEKQQLNQSITQHTQIPKDDTFKI